MLKKRVDVFVNDQATLVASGPTPRYMLSKVFRRATLDGE